VAKKVTTRAGLDRVCSVAASLRAPQLPLFRAAADGFLAVIYITDAAAPFPRRLANRAGRPVALLIGADPDVGQTPPPHEWRCATDAAAWARSAMVHAAGGEAVHYHEAVRTTLAAGRFVLIETNSANYAAWLKIFRPLMRGGIRLVYPTNGVHPIAMMREAVQ